jgi:hypothetical protein
MVCPHDTVKEPERWYRLEHYLIHHLGVDIQFDISLDAIDFETNLEHADIVYTNPSDKLRILAPKGFVSVARPANLYDETVLVANTEVEAPTLEALQGADIATVKSLMPTRIAFHLLSQKGITPGTIHDKDSWLSVISSVWNKEVEFGFVYKDTYNNLSDQGKAMIQVFATTNEQKAFHTIDIGPKLLDRQAEVEQIFLHMDADEQGREVLNELGIEKWLAVPQESITLMEQIMRENG